jgi:hypothetical protein
MARAQISDDFSEKSFRAWKHELFRITSVSILSRLSVSLQVGVPGNCPIGSSLKLVLHLRSKILNEKFPQL